MISSDLTIIVLFYNQERYVNNLLDNIKECNYKIDSKIMLVDDYSSDNTYASIKKWLKENNDLDYKVIKNNSNLGISESILNAISFVDTKWIKIHGGDDFFAKGSIGRFNELVESSNPESTVYMTDVSIINEKNEIIGYRKCPSRITFNKFFKDINYYTNNLMAFSVLAGKDVYSEALKSMPFYKNAEDWPFLIYTIKNNFNYKIINERLIEYRVHENSISHFISNKSKNLTDHQRTLRNEIINMLEIHSKEAPTISSRFGSYIQLLSYNNTNFILNKLVNTLKYINVKYVLYRLLSKIYD